MGEEDNKDHEKVCEVNHKAKYTTPNATKVGAILSCSKTYVLQQNFRLIKYLRKLQETLTPY